MTDALTHPDALSLCGGQRVHSFLHRDNKGCRGAYKESPSGSSGASETRAELEALARRVSRLGPDRRDPERFHMDRSEIVAELRRLARVWA